MLSAKNHTKYRSTLYGWLFSFLFASENPFSPSLPVPCLPGADSPQSLALWLPVRGGQWQAASVGDEMVRGEQGQGISSLFLVRISQEQWFPLLCGPSSS